MTAGLVPRPLDERSPRSGAGAPLLAGKVVLVTGAAQGIGRAYVTTLAEQGATVVANDLPTGDPAGDPLDDLEELARTLGHRGCTVLAQRSDVATWDGAGQAVQAALATFGRLDGLVNNAGSSRRVALAELDEADVDAELGVHVKGTVGCMSHACRHWRTEARAGRRRPASVVNTASGAVLVGTPGSACYAAAKAAVVALTRSASIELADYGVRANVVAPSGWTRLAAGGDRLAGDGAPVPHPEDQEAGSPVNPLRNAPLVAWLLSDRSTHVSGQFFRLRHGQVRRIDPAPTSRWVRLVAEDGSWTADGVHDAMNGSVLGCTFPAPEREYPDRPSEPYARPYHG
ncbi:MAG: SDR family NAD(P)-dependent oxidoreductase [Acidimicrobiia bacterium]